MRGPSHDPEWPIRRAAFEAVERMMARHGPVLPWRVIDEGFQFEGQRLRLANKARGIFWPAGMRSALSIKSVIARKGREQPYEDSLSLYHFRRGDLKSPDNTRLQEAERLGTPLIYFVAVIEGHYRPFWPVFVRGIREEAPGEMVCDVAVDVDDKELLTDGLRVADNRTIEIRRQYITVQATKRLHQDKFRELVLRAYECRCAVCLLPGPELLQAAHIIPDRYERGVPSVQNGLSLCHLHHGAFDAELMGIRPDGVIELSPRLLKLQDGPTLEHGLRYFHQRLLHLPRSEREHPKPEWLEVRYEQFRQAG